MTPYYQDDAVTIYHGDCREILPGLGPVDMVLTDPPYSDSTHSNAKTNAGGKGGVKGIDFECWTAENLRNVLVTCGSLSRAWVVLSCDWKHAAQFDLQAPEGLRLMRVGVWVKPNPMPQISADRPAMGWEAIAYFHRSDKKPSWYGGGTHGNFVDPLVSTGEHPTQKPASIYRSMLSRFTAPGEMVADPFCGVGTSLRAAKDLGRKAIGIELNERYCEIAARRMGQEVLAL